MYKIHKEFIVLPDEYTEWFCNGCGNHFKVDVLVKKQVVMCPCCGSLDTEKLE